MSEPTKITEHSSSSAPTRRDFLMKSAASVAALHAWQAIPLVAADNPPPAADPRRLFEFVQINDAHVQSPLSTPQDEKPPHTYPRANDKFTWWIDAVNREPRPDFIVAIGDLVHGGRLDRLPVDFAQLKELLKPLQPPLYTTLGNHEVVQNEGNPEYERPYRKVFGDDRVSYTFEHGGLLFIMLNNAGAAVVKDNVIRARNNWLRGVLEKNPTKEKILCCHIPIIPVRDEKTLAESFGFKSFHAHDPELLSLVDAYASSILAVLSGHLHLTGYTTRKGVHHISISGTASYPSDYARFAVFDNKIEMTVQQLPGDLNNTAPTLHGKPRHEHDFTDTTHTTADEYQRGRPNERQLTITRKPAAS